MGRLSALPSAVPVKVVKLRNEPQQPSSRVHGLTSRLLRAFNMPYTSLCLLHLLLNISFHTRKLIGQAYYFYFIDDKH